MKPYPGHFLSQDQLFTMKRIAEGLKAGDLKN
jgi:hypothetical protein